MRETGSVPIDPELETSDVRAAPRRRSRWPRLESNIVFAVFAGGVAGGLARYGIGFAAATPANGFPWDVLVINLAGGFALALLLVLVLELSRPSRYLRPALGTGFLGAFTTFSSLAVATDRLWAHTHPGLAAAYVLSSLVGGLIAAMLGLIAGRAALADIANQHRLRRRNGATS
jgi:CrcB protein